MCSNGCVSWGWARVRCTYFHVILAFLSQPVRGTHAHTHTPVCTHAHIHIIIVLGYSPSHSIPPKILVSIFEIDLMALWIGCSPHFEKCWARPWLPDPCVRMLAYAGKVPLPCCHGAKDRFVHRSETHPNTKCLQHPTAAYKPAVLWASPTHWLTQPPHLTAATLTPLLSLEHIQLTPSFKTWLSPSCTALNLPPQIQIRKTFTPFKWQAPIIFYMFTLLCFICIYVFTVYLSCIKGQDVCIFHCISESGEVTGTQ